MEEVEKKKKRSKKAPEEVAENTEKTVEKTPENTEKSVEKAEKTPEKQAKTGKKTQKKPEKEVKNAEKTVKNEEILPETEPKKAKKPRKKETANEEISDETAKKEEPKTEEPKNPARKPRVKKTANEQKTEDAKEEEASTETVSLAPEKKEEKYALHTRAEKKDAVMALVKECLKEIPFRRTQLLDEVTKAYAQRFPSPETENVNDVKGRVGSVITLMEQSGEIVYQDGLFFLGEAKKSAIKDGESQKSAKKDGETPADKQAETAVGTPIDKTAEQDKVGVKKGEIDEALPPVVAPESKLAPVFDMSLLLGGEKSGKTSGNRVAAAEKTAGTPREKTEKTVQKETPTEEKSVRETAGKTVARRTRSKAETPAEKLKERFLKKMRSLGGSYLEYYAVYLLQRYAQQNGRRLEALRVCGGERDGGIDGEIELTDAFGFRETLYIQAKNWEPTDEKWMVGETLLQQFIGAVTYRQTQSGKAHCRGVYVTTSQFTEGAKKMLDDLSEKFVGYDGEDLFELAKECRFGVILKDGAWTIDEALLAGEKAFFNL